MKSEGIIAFDTRIEDPFTHWTKTVWVDEPSMRRFRNGGAHQLAMRLLSEICNEAAYVRWQQETPNPPTWEEAHHRMLSEGWLSKVKHPTPRHSAGQSAPELTNL